MCRRFGLLVVSHIACACASPPEPVDCGSPVSSPQRVRQPLNGGVPTAAYLGLAESELEAVVELEVTDDTGTTLSKCSGTLIAPSWVLSAAHCDPGVGLSFQVHTVDGAGNRGRNATAIRALHHPDLDLLLLEVPPAQFAAVPPLPVRLQASSALAIGQRVQLAGTGASEALAGAPRLFSVATIFSVSPSLITVNAAGYAGACLGDSGGPMLSRGSGGQPEVIGVLTDGSATCWAEDNYVRTEAAADWIASVVKGFERRDWSCGSLDERGRCFGALAVWCDLGALSAKDCGAAGADCGFDAKADGFRCVSPSADPCRGIGDLGECVEGNAQACVAGRLLTNTCAACGAVCLVSPRSGRAVCLEPT